MVHWEELSNGQSSVFFLSIRIWVQMDRIILHFGSLSSLCGWFETELGRSDYVDKNGVGKFVHFMEDALGKSYLKMDHDFPLSRKYSRACDRDAAILRVFDICSKWDGSNHKRFIRSICKWILDQVHGVNVDMICCDVICDVAGDDIDGKHDYYTSPIVYSSDFQSRYEPLHDSCQCAMCGVQGVKTMWTVWNAVPEGLRIRAREWMRVCGG